MIRRTYLALVLCLCAAGPLDAQRHPVSPGDRVRVSARSFPRTSGTVLDARPDSLVLRARGGDTIHAAWADVRTLEVSGGKARVSTALRNGSIGLLAGAVAGGVFGYAVYHEDDDDWCIVVCSRSDAGLAGAAFFGLVGGATGTLSGAVFPAHRWRRAEAPVSVSAAPVADGGVALHARLRF
jgi:hypothetical protein